MIDTKRIMSQLDEWVKAHGNGRYADPMAPDVVTPIQQVRREIEELVIVLLSKLTDSVELSTTGKYIIVGKHGMNSCLDIGLGEFGGTHVLWRMLFTSVVGIENDGDKIQSFLDREGGPRTIVHGSSHDQIIRAQCRNVGPYDFLHIDGDHTYEGVGRDYQDYTPMVRPGGMIAIHDLLLPDVNRFVCELEQQGHEFIRILHSTHVGYALEIKK